MTELTQLAAKTPVERCPERACPEFTEGPKGRLKAISKPSVGERSAVLGLDTAVGFDTLRYSGRRSTSELRKSCE